MNCGLLAILLALAPTAAGDEGVDVPRYRLTPGREIAYRSDAVQTSTEEFRTGTDWTGWVLGVGADGSARLLIREVNHYSWVRGGQPGKLEPRTRLTYADVSPDGRVLPGPETRFARGLPLHFPRLPRDAAEARGGWVDESPEEKHTATPADGGRFVVAREMAMDRASPAPRKSTFTFDAARGLVCKAETESTQSYGPGRTLRGTFRCVTTLTAERTLAPAELARLAADAGRYFAAAQPYEDALAAAERHPPGPAKATIGKAFDALTPAAEAVTQPDMKADLLARVQGHESAAKHALNRGARRAVFVGQPAFAFDALDLAGKPVKLGDFGGKVVVLAFWERGNGWTVQCMPQLNRLAADFAREPVALLGMNTDADPADAGFVAKEFALKYPSDRVDRATADKYGVELFPSLAVIDRRGVLRDVLVNYSPTLREDAGRLVRALLAEKP